MEIMEDRLEGLGIRLFWDNGLWGWSEDGTGSRCFECCDSSGGNALVCEAGVSLPSCNGTLFWLFWSDFGLLILFGSSSIEIQRRKVPS